MSSAVPLRDTNVSTLANPQASTAYDLWTIKQGRSLFGGDVARAFATELVANANDCALSTLLKLPQAQRDERWGDLPVTELEYQSQAKYANGLPAFRIRTRSEIKPEDIDKMFHLTGKGGRVHFNHDLGQGAKIAFLQIDPKIIVEVYAIDATVYVKDPEQPITGFVTLYRLFPDTSDEVGQVHRHIKLPFYIFMDKDDDRKVEELLWLTDGGEGNATEEQRANLDMYLLNTMHVYHTRRGAQGVDTVKTRDKVVEVLNDALAAALDCPQHVVVDQLLHSERWKTEQRVRYTSDGDIEILSQKLATKADEVRLQNLTDGGVTVYENDPLPGEDYWTSLAQYTQNQFGMYAQPLPSTTLEYSGEQLHHERVITINGKKLSDVVSPDPNVSYMLDNILEGLKAPTGDARATSVVEYSAQGAAAKLYCTLHPNARKINVPGKSSKQPGMGYADYDARKYKGGVHVFKHGRLLSTDPADFGMGNLCEFKDGVAYHPNYQQLAQTNKNIGSFLRDTLMRLGFKPNRTGALDIRRPSEGQLSEDEQFRELFPGGTAAFYTLFSPNTQHKKDTTQPVGLKDRWAPKRTDIFAKVMGVDVIAVLDTDVQLNASKTKIKDLGSAFSMMKLTNRELFKFTFQNDPLMNKGYQLALDLQAHPEKCLKMPSFEDKEGAEHVGGAPGRRNAAFLAEKLKHHHEYCERQYVAAPDEVHELQKAMAYQLCQKNKEQLLQGTWADGTVEAALKSLMRHGPFHHIKPNQQRLRTQSRREFQAIIDMDECLKVHKAAMTWEQTDKMKNLAIGAMREHEHCKRPPGAPGGVRPKRQRKSAAAGPSSAPGISSLRTTRVQSIDDDESENVNEPQPTATRAQPVRCQSTMDDSEDGDKSSEHDPDSDYTSDD